MERVPVARISPLDAHGADPSERVARNWRRCQPEIIASLDRHVP